ncbi:MAG TPA: hypothetical protein VGK45_14575 [Thermoanaerobaculia bacterium]
MKNKLPPKVVKALPEHEEQPLAVRPLYLLERPRRKKQKPVRSTSFAVGLGVALALGVIGFGCLTWVLAHRRPAEVPTPEPVVIYKEKPAPAPPPPPPPIVVPEPPPPPKAPPPPPPPPPSPWTGFYHSEKVKQSLRLSVDEEGVKGFYSPGSGFYEPSLLQNSVLKGDVLTFSVVLGTRRFGMRAMRLPNGTIEVWKWIDIDGLLDEYRLVDAAFAQRRVTLQQALLARQQLQMAMKKAGPDHAALLDIFVREDAPKMRTGR